MYSVANKPEKCIECKENNNNDDGWFICQECRRIFCSQHSIVHRHPLIQEQAPTERYNRHVHLDQIAEWERKAIEKIRKQADEARRPLIAPPTPITQTSPSTILVNESHSGPFTRLLTASSNFEKPSPTIDEYELLSDETLDEMIGDNPLTSPPDEISIPGRVSFASQYPYMTGIHRLRLSIDKFNYSSSWAFVGIVSEGITIQNTENSNYLNRSSFGWHLGRQSIVFDRQTSTSHDYDGRDIRSGDILTIIIDCDQNTIEIKNERTLHTHIIYINSNYCPFPWLFAVNFNYRNKDSMHLLKSIMVWNIIIPIVYRYTAVITFPVAIVLGGLGYYIERHYRGVPYTPVPHEKAIIDERSERQSQQQYTASPYRMETVVPKTIFNRNNPEDLKKSS